MTDRPHTPVLDRVTWPADLRRLTDAQLKQCADELRAETISAVSETGGHLGSSLGVVVAHQREHDVAAAVLAQHGERARHTG